MLKKHFLKFLLKNKCKKQTDHCLDLLIPIFGEYNKNRKRRKRNGNLEKIEKMNSLLFCFNLISTVYTFKLKD